MIQTKLNESKAAAALLNPAVVSSPGQSRQSHSKNQNPLKHLRGVRSYGECVG